MYIDIEYNKIEMHKTNLQKLKILVDELESLDSSEVGYPSLLLEIEKIIEKERTIISNLVKSDRKISHYENICSTILSLINKNKQ